MYTVMLMTNHSQEAFAIPCIVYDTDNAPFSCQTIEQAKGFLKYLQSEVSATETYQIFKLSPIDVNKELS